MAESNVVNHNTSIKFYTLGLLTLAGVVFSIALSKHFYEVRSGEILFKSFCNLSAQMNCDRVAASAYAELFFGIPLSNFAAGWYLSLIGILLFGMSRFWMREVIRAAFLWTLIGTFFTLIYLLVMIFILKTYCLLCLVLDGINLVSLGVALSLKPDFTKLRELDRSQWKVFGIGTFVVLCLSLLFLKNLGSETLPASQIDEAAQSILNTAPLSVQEGLMPLALGPMVAPISIIEFSDFQCPHCKKGALIMHALQGRYPNQIRVVFRNFPLDPSCNRSLQTPGHHVACEAAKVAICGASQGKFQEIYEKLFENQTSLETGVPAKLAQELGLNAEKLSQCIKSKETQKLLSQDIEDALLLKIESTPTFFINGRKVEGAYPLSVWEKVIENLLPQGR